MCNVENSGFNKLIKRKPTHLFKDFSHEREQTLTALQEPSTEKQVMMIQQGS